MGIGLLGPLVLQLYPRPNRTKVTFASLVAAMSIGCSSTASTNAGTAAARRPATTAPIANAVAITLLPK